MYKINCRQLVVQYIWIRGWFPIQHKSLSTVENIRIAGNYLIIKSSRYTNCLDPATDNNYH